MAEVLALASFGRKESECPFMPHSDERGALAYAADMTKRALSGWSGLAHSVSTSDVPFQHPATGAATPVTASARSRAPRAAAPALVLGAMACTPGTPDTLAGPTAFAGGARRSSR